MMEQRWPDRLWVVRHGESAGNVARAAALAERRSVIDIATRDVDVPLSRRGEEQAAALGRWFARFAPDARPEILMSSPYLRARRTGDLLAEAGGLSPGACRSVD